MYKIKFFQLGLILLLCHLTLQALDKTFAGPYELIIEKIESCQDEGTREIEFGTFRINKISRTKFAYSGYVNFKKPVDNTSKAVLMVDVWGNGGWKPNYFRQTIYNPCEIAMFYSPKYFRSILNAGNISGCPIPIGNRYFKEFLVDPDLIFPTLPYNKLRGKFDFYDQHSKIGCIALNFLIKPKVVLPK